MLDTKNVQRGTRDRILEAAVEEFAEYGLSGARVDRIARRAGVNKAMIYYHFSSKDRLYEAILSNFAEKISTVFGEVFGTETEPDMESAFLKIAHVYHSLFGGKDKFMRVFMHEMADGGGRLQEIHKKAFTRQGIPLRMKDLLDRARDRGVIRDIDSREAIISFIGMNMFYLIMAPIVKSLWEIDNETEFLATRPEVVVDLFLRGILVR